MVRDFHIGQTKFCKIQYILPISRKKDLQNNHKNYFDNSF